MTEQQLKDFDRLYKDHYLPRHRLYMAVPYNIVVAGLCMYYTMNIRKISKKYFSPKKFGFLDLLKYGTIQAGVFVTGYVTGTMLVTGLWQPIQFARDISKIQGTIIDQTVRHDTKAQKYFLYNFMEYFGISQTVIEQAQKDLEKQKKELEESHFFTKETLKVLKEKEREGIDYEGDDDEDDEEEEKEQLSNKQKQQQQNQTQK
ncbi:hypothetical protein PPERSA_05447 [Pseudocohnilembus persalinus]|uniref:Uncharacterized protein n=1 Tax=Pseudocohnilembus persalinus TaxID=266149 RepID=A0A0V0R817_PSEPJ|nr:hypothetical protein PPERSA_05447 [Pseudocohnilembus persalinus]|eukprot:KRX10627.1 hypothetical protein PPERSA_05447 [Pseudocohnilembus persalinus]